MRRRPGLSIRISVASASILAVLTTLCLACPQAKSQTGASTKIVRASPAQAPPADEIQAHAKKLIENQHKNDQALEEYERIERYQDFTTGASPQTIQDKVYR
ncbi:MAG: hypothetical protein WAJ86_17020, partial [Candidatus Acidiferrales bacterium]